VVAANVAWAGDGVAVKTAETVGVVAVKDACADVGVTVCVKTSGSAPIRRLTDNPVGA